MIKDVCRLCLVEDHVNVSIFEQDGDVEPIFQKIAACLPVNIDRDDQFPKKVCQDCSSKVEAFHKFWETTANSEKRLHDWFETDPGAFEDSGQNRTLKKEILTDQESNNGDQDNEKSSQISKSSPFGTFCFHQQKVQMQKWQMLEFNGKMYYAFVPSGHEPFETPMQELNHNSEENLKDDSIETEPSEVPDTVTLYKSQVEVEQPEIEESKANVKPKKCPEKLNEGDRSYKCKACFEIFKSTIEFKRHVAWKHKKKIVIQENGTYYCTNCDYYSNVKNHFNIHLQIKHKTWSQAKRDSKRSYPCQTCGFICRSKHSLQSHFIRKHTDTFQHRCEDCNKAFKVKGDLTNHIRFHHREKPVECNICGKMCSNSGSLYVHQKWAHFKPKFECTVCKRRMVTQENLDLHMQSQHGHKDKIICAECGKSFSKKDSFKRHQSVHTGAKPHTCMICKRSFARRSQLRQHLLIHTGKRPFECDICGKTFTQKPGLICHRKTHPGEHPPLPVMPIGDIVKEFTEEFYNNQNLEEQIGEEETEVYLSDGEEVRVEFVDLPT